MNTEGSSVRSGQETSKTTPDFLTHFSNQEKLQQVAGHADAKNQNLVSRLWIEHPWKQIPDCGDEALHGHKLESEKKETTNESEMCLYSSLTHTIEFSLHASQQPTEWASRRNKRSRTEEAASEPWPEDKW